MINILMTISPHSMSESPSIPVLLPPSMPQVTSPGLVACSMSAFMPLIIGGRALGDMIHSSSALIHLLLVY